MIFPKWYIASFCKTCTDGRNWAQYGDNHKGGCLVFKTHDSSYGKGLKLKVCNAYSSTQGKIYNYTIEPLRRGCKKTKEKAASRKRKDAAFFVV